MAERLQAVMDRSNGAEACCDMTDPHWYHDGVVCRCCGTLLADMARPDLGRRRSDGRLKGWVRLLITDGYPMTNSAKFPKEQKP